MITILKGEKPIERARRENALAAAVRAQAIDDYNIMMGNLEDPMEEEEDGE